MQLHINFSYTIDVRFVKHAFMMHLSMLIMAIIHIKSNSDFWIYKNSSFCDFAQKDKLSSLEKISLISWV